MAFPQMIMGSYRKIYLKWLMVEVHDLLGQVTDHCLTSMELRCLYENNLTEKSDIQKIGSIFKWNSQSEFIYKSTLASDQIEIINLHSEMHVDEMVGRVNDILHATAYSVLRKRKIINKTRKRNGSIPIVISCGKK